MCYECGCGNTKTIMSNDSITEDTFKKAAIGSHISLKQAKKNTFDLLKKELAQEPGIQETVTLDEDSL
jgi:hypothetical protein